MTVLVKVVQLVADLEQVGALFREARGNETQRSFARRLGLTDIHLCRVENGRAMPSLKVIRRLRKALQEVS